MRKCVSVFLVVVFLGVVSVRSIDAQTAQWVDSVLTFGHSEVQASFSLFEDVFLDEPVSILVVGTLELAGPPLEDVVTTEPGTEITYAITGLAYLGSWVWDGGPPGGSLEWGGTFHEFSDGYFRLYADDAPDHDFSDPSTFQDGDLLLEARVPSYKFWSGAGYPCPQCYPEHFGDVEFTGGLLFHRVSRDGVGYRGNMVQTSFGEAPLDSLLLPGTSYPTHGRLGLSIPVPVRETTWGKIKQLFAR